MTSICLFQEISRSPIPFLSRAGFAVGSIEGRVAIEHFNAMGVSRECYARLLDQILTLTSLPLFQIADQKPTVLDSTLSSSVIEISAMMDPMTSTGLITFLFTLL